MNVYLVTDKDAVWLVEGFTPTGMYGENWDIVIAENKSDARRIARHPGEAVGVVLTETQARALFDGRNQS